MCDAAKVVLEVMVVLVVMVMTVVVVVAVVAVVAGVKTVDRAMVEMVLGVLNGVYALRVVVTD